MSEPMTTLVKCPVYVLDDDSSFVRPFADAGARIVARRDLLDAYRAAGASSRWVTSGWEGIAPLAELTLETRPAYGLLLADRLVPPEPVLQEVLHRYFRTIDSPSRSAALLDAKEAATVIAAEESGDYVLAAQVVGDRLFLVRGSFEILTVPLLSFRPTSSGRRPDFGRLSIVDHGLAIAFGDYESTVDVILYDHDKEYRRRAKARERSHDKSFGAALRRLRLLRGLRQSDFFPIDEREIRRLEGNEVRQPQEDTRRILAKRLNVPFEEISTY
jgi:hypothetical protein